MTPDTKPSKHVAKFQGFLVPVFGEKEVIAHAVIEAYNGLGNFLPARSALGLSQFALMLDATRDNPARPKDATFLIYRKMDNSAAPALKYLGRAEVNCDEPRSINLSLNQE